MKNLLLLICLIASFSVYAQREKACRVYEFAELKTFPDAELIRMKNEYNGIFKQIGTIVPITAAEFREDMNDQKNCSDERDRIGRILESRQITRKKN